jgi:hypothetical protein
MTPSVIDDYTMSAPDAFHARRWWTVGVWLVADFHRRHRRGFSIRAAVNSAASASPCYVLKRGFSI